MLAHRRRPADLAAALLLLAGAGAPDVAGHDGTAPGSDAEARDGDGRPVDAAGAGGDAVGGDTAPGIDAAPGDAAARAFGYSAAGDTLTLYSTDSGTTTVAVLTRQ
jgi:hypothetical protein